MNKILRKRNHDSNQYKILSNKIITYSLNFIYLFSVKSLLIVVMIEICKMQITSKSRYSTIYFICKSHE